MDLGESAAYLRHHLAPGRPRKTRCSPMTPLARLHRVSNGLPRALNNAATAWGSSPPRANSKTIVDDACAKKAAAELTRD